MKHIDKGPLAKALEINQDTKIYGTFAEIGAGQEVARFFFQAGKASQTVAKTISAYDMIYSDEIYGKEANGRYVCESRLNKMLEKEFTLIQRRLTPSRGAKSTFFTYANTVTTGDQTRRYCHGWMGVRFQTKPNGPSNDIVLHVRMLDKYRLQQQETLGTMGVNLVYAAFNYIEKPEHFIKGLVENIKEGQVAIDLVRFAGPDVSHINNHLMNLELVKRGLAEAILFGPDGDILSVADSLYEKSVFVERGNFRPVTKSHIDLFNTGVKSFEKQFSGKKNTLSLFEITMHALQTEKGSSKELDEQDFLDRVRTISSLGHHTLVSNFFLFYRLKQFLRQYTKEPIGMVIGASLLPRILDEKHYLDLEGGILEGLGKLLDQNTHLYVYPSKDNKACSTAASFKPAQSVHHVFQYFLEKEWIKDIGDCNKVDDFISSEQVRKLMSKKDSEWKKLVPPSVKDLIEKEKLFGYK
jgi:hypothetical protein